MWDDINPEEEHQKRLIAFKKALQAIENQFYENKEGKKKMLKNYVNFDDKEVTFSDDCPKEVRSLIRKMVNKHFVPPYKG